jgi:chromosome segregation ATPase
VEPLFAEHQDDTEEHTVLYSPPGDAAGSAARLAELAERAKQIRSLEAQIRVLTDSARDLEHRAAEKDQRIEELNDKLAKLRQSMDDSAAAGRKLATQVAVREAQVAELTANVERLGQDAAAASAELEQLRGLAAAAHRETEALRGELATRPARDATSPDVQELRENHAALATYIAARRASWDDMQATNARLVARVAELEHECKIGAKRLAAADALANRESSRAVALRAELVGFARRVDTLERELRLARASAEPAQEPILANEAEARPAPLDSAGLAPSAAPSSDVPTANAAPREVPPVLSDAVDAAPAVEAIAQLEAEVEQRQQTPRSRQSRSGSGSVPRRATSIMHASQSAAHELEDSHANVADSSAPSST